MNKTLMAFLLPGNDAWYQERVALSKYFATASGAVITALVLIADKAPNGVLDEHRQLFAFVIFIFGLSALCGFLSYVFSYRGRFYYARFERIIKAAGQNRTWGRRYVWMAKLRRPIELGILYCSFFVATLCFPVGIVLVTYLLFTAYWQ